MVSCAVDRVQEVNPGQSENEVNYLMDVELYNGDCLQLMSKINDGSVDMILCDLPYGTTARNRWDTVIPFEPLWEQYERVTKENGAIVLFSQMPFGADLIRTNRKMFRYEWIWQKHQGTGFLNANRMPMRAHENILVFYKKLPTYNPQKTDGEPYAAKSGAKTSTNYGFFDGEWNTVNKTGKRFPLDVIKYPSVRGDHPTQKPVPLLEYLIKTYTNEGDTVLDNCMGSGSTGVAAVNTGRNFIGIELDENYFQVAKERINEVYAQQCLPL